MEREIKNNSGIRAAITSGMVNAIAQLIGVSDRHNSMYGMGDFTDMVMRAAYRNASIGGCATSLVAARAAVGGVSRTPSDEWFGARLAAVDPDAARAVFMAAVADQLRTLKKLGKLPKDGLVIAMDAHPICGYDRTRGAELARSRYKNGAMFFERYVTVQRVNDGARVHLGFIPVPAQESVPAMAHKLIERCMEHGMEIKLTMFDREFFTAENIRNLNRLGVNYVIPCRNTATVVEGLNLFAEGKIGDAMRLTIRGDGVAASYNMVVAPRRKIYRKKSAAAAENKHVGFATNMPRVDVIVYAGRWGVESGYANVEAMRARTRSRKLGARPFCFMCSLLVYNLWVVVKALMLYMEASLTRRQRTVTQLAFKEILRVIIEDTGPGPPPAA